MAESQPLTILISDAARQNALEAGVNALRPAESLNVVVGDHIATDENGNPLLLIGGRRTTRDVRADPTDIYRVAIKPDGEVNDLRDELPAYPLPDTAKQPACPMPKSWDSEEISGALYDGTHRRIPMGKIMGRILVSSMAIGASAALAANESSSDPQILSNPAAIALGAALALAPAGLSIGVSVPLLTWLQNREIKAASTIESLTPVINGDQPEPETFYVSAAARREAMNANVRRLHVDQGDMTALTKLLGNQEAAQRLVGNGLLLRTTTELEREREHGMRWENKYFQLRGEPQILNWMDEDYESQTDLERRNGVTIIPIEKWDEATIRDSIFRTGKKYGKDFAEWPVLTAMTAAMGAAGSLVYETIAQQSDNPTLQHLGAFVIGAAIGYVADKVRIYQHRRSVAKKRSKLAPVRIEHARS